MTSSGYLAQTMILNQHPAQLSTAICGASLQNLHSLLFQGSAAFCSRAKYTMHCSGLYPSTGTRRGARAGWLFFLVANIHPPTCWGICTATLINFRNPRHQGSRSPLQGYNPSGICTHQQSNCVRTWTKCIQMPHGFKMGCKQMIHMVHTTKTHHCDR